MIDEMIVQKTLNVVRLCENGAWVNFDLHQNDLSGLTSTIICNIFGGEILKKRLNNVWHFYNQIDGNIIDFMTGEISNRPGKNNLQDLPALPFETYEYFEQEDYLTFYMEFITAFEQEVGLEYKSPAIPTIKLQPEYKL